MNWLISLWRSKEARSLNVGARVNTKWGPGTITGGAVNVKLDTPEPAVNRHSVAVNLNTVEVL